MRCYPKNDITFDALVGRLTTFELDNFDNYNLGSQIMESNFKAKINIGNKGGSSKGKQSDSEEEEEKFDDDIEAIEALLARRLLKGKGKYEGKITLICFSCEEVGHIIARCPNKEGKDDKKSSKFKRRKISKATKNTKIKVRNLAILLKILTVIMKMKWCILLLRMNQMMRIMKI